MQGDSQEIPDAAFDGSTLSIGLGQDEARGGLGQRFHVERAKEAIISRFLYFERRETL